VPEERAHRTHGQDPYYGLLARPHNFFLFQTGNIEVVRLAQRMFGFVLPSFLVEKRSNKFYMV